MTSTDPTAGLGEPPGWLQRGTAPLRLSLPDPARAAWTAVAVCLALLAVAAAVLLGGARPSVPAEPRDWLLAMLCAPLGGRIAGHATRNACGWLLLAVGLLAAGTTVAAVLPAATAVWLRDWLWWPSYGLLVLIALLFPTGRPPSRRWRPVVATVAAAVAAGSAALAALAAREPGLLLFGGRVAPGWDTLVFLAATVVLVAGAGLAVLALVLRVRHTARPARAPLVWALINAVLLMVAAVLDAAHDFPAVWLVGTLAVPLAATVGVLRYGLYDIDLLVHRSLLYGLLTVASLGVYAAVVAAAARLVPVAAAPAAAAMTVVALQPLRQGLHALLGRWLYGHSADPYALVAAVSRRISLAHTPDDVLAAAVTAVADGLRVPYAAVHLNGQAVAEAAAGRRRGWPVDTLTLTYRGGHIGDLVVQQRSPDEAWSARERSLLARLAEQLGPPAASVALTRDLRSARERLVRAREEELRRLQRELHDGLGPALAGARMLTRAARGPRAAAHLAQLEADLADAATELRRIVDGLRPPALDRGLAAALDTAARRHDCPDLAVTLTVVGELAGLPAAVEVAAFRIVDEALTNVVRHAGAGRARVTVTRGERELRLDVDDDGVGIDADPPAGTPCGDAVRQSGGVGLGSLRERCVELGGQLEVLARPRGTRVTATLPVG